jgi:hypothetical protein
MNRPSLKSHETSEHWLKKALTLYIWRMQESQTLISILFYSLTLTGIYLGRMLEPFGNMGIDSVALITLILTLFTFILILLAGYIYDRIFNLWKDKNVVMMKKNIYLSTHLFPKESAWFSQMWLPLVKALDRMEGQDTLKETIKTLEYWEETGLFYRSSEDQVERSKLKI